MREIHIILDEERREIERKKSLVKNIPGELRNQKCPCGSLRKAKNCHCENFKGAGYERK